METKQKRLLVIDDNAAFRDSVTLAGKNHGWVVFATDRLGWIEDWLERYRPDVVLLDWQLPDGKERHRYAELLKKKGLTERTLLLSGAIDDKRRAFVEECGLAGMRLKPLDLERFEEEIRLPLGRLTKGLQAIPEPEEPMTLEGFADESTVAVDVLDVSLTNILLSNARAQREPLTPEQRLIAKWLQAEIMDGQRDNVRRIDWDGTKGCFLESTLYRNARDQYALVRDWRDRDERRPHDSEFFNLQEESPTLESWLRAVAKFLAKRYAISRFRVYKISPLRHMPAWESQRESLVIPKFQSGGGIVPNSDSWIRTGFKPESIPHIKNALQINYKPLPEVVKRPRFEGGIPHVQYGKEGNYRVLFPVRDPGTGENTILLAMDRRLDHAEEEDLKGFDKEVVELAARMASDEAGVLNEEQWGLMQGLVEDIGRRIAIWLEDDEQDRIVEWHKGISMKFIDIFADTTSSPEMIYDGISQVCAALAKKWNQDGKDGEPRISGHVRGTTPYSEQQKKGHPVSSWCIGLVVDGNYLQVIAGWGMAYEACRRNGGRITDMLRGIAREGELVPWQAVVIQDFQKWSEQLRLRNEQFIPCECLRENVRQGIGSWLAVPMKVEGEIRALMMVHSPHACYFTKFHTALMEYTAERLLPLLAAALRETRARNAFTAAVMHEVKNDSHAALLLLDEIERGNEQALDLEALTEIRHHMEGLNALGQDSLDIFRVGNESGKTFQRKKQETITATLGMLLKNAALGWRTLYEETECDIQFSDDTPASCKVQIPHALGFRRVLRVLLHNAFRHGQDWVRVVARLDNRDGSEQVLKLTIANGSYDDTVSGLGVVLNSVTDRAGASPLVRGRLGLMVAKQITVEAGGNLGELTYTPNSGGPGRAEVSLSWPVEIIS
uniref:DNA-binding response regulator, OmpR family, contains REC and winged-helix (WHTH) domain n=1 Tax=Candidatus Kentrum sp. DK TaxID=2126562 RepID=A0A450SSA6_9GAMM|nr:MAG: DNA-binding response regulator, OmpR family, contains REC and winged-helix (wHTH) domain [Candidatus Kentron sp. DK]